MFVGGTGPVSCGEFRRCYVTVAVVVAVIAAASVIAVAATTAACRIPEKGGIGVPGRACLLPCIIRLGSLSSVATKRFPGKKGIPMGTVLFP